MAEDKIEKISGVGNVDACVKAFDEGDYFDAFSIYNTLTIEKQRELLPRVAMFYASVGDAFGEYDALMKMIAYPHSHNLDPYTIMSRMSRFIVPIAGADYLIYYHRLVEKNFGVNFGSDMTDKDILGLISDPPSKPKLRLAQLGDGGEFDYNQALIYAEDGKNKLAKEKLRGITPNDCYYIEAQKYYAFLLQNEGKIDGAIRSLKKVLQLNPSDEDTIKRLATLAKNYGEKADDIYDFILKLEYDGKKSILPQLKAEILIKRKMWEDAREELNKIEDIAKFSEPYLEMKAKVYFKLGEYDSVKDILKQTIAIYPKNVKARYKLKSLELGSVDGILNLTGQMSDGNQLKQEAMNFLNNTTEKDFLKLNQQELLYYFRTILYYGDDVSLKKISLIMFTNEKIREYLLDSLLEIETNEKQKEIILSTVCQLHITNELYVLVYGKLKKIKISYPKILFNKNYLDGITSPSKTIKKSEGNYLVYLVNGYSQAFTLRVFDEEGSYNKFSRNAEAVVKGILNMPKEDRWIFDNLDNLVFAFCYADCSRYYTNKLMFASTPMKVKSALVELVNMFKLDYGVKQSKKPRKTKIIETKKV